jgi:hypothetical protein
MLSLNVMLRKMIGNRFDHIFTIENIDDKELFL